MIDRKKVYQKYKGKCAYCGNHVEYKDFQVDHIVPKTMEIYLIDNKKAINKHGTSVNDFSNLNPSCRQCNHYKRSYDLEQFRHLMKTLHERVSKQYIVKVAIDYGIVRLKPFNGVFYFEEVTK